MYDKVVEKQIRLYPDEHLNLKTSAVNLARSIIQTHWNESNLSGNMNLKSPVIFGNTEGYNYSAVLNNKSDMHEDVLIDIYMTIEQIMAFELDELRGEIQNARRSTGYIA